MRKILLSLVCISLLSTAADAKRYIVTVENTSRAPINWDMFVSRAGGNVVETFDSIDGALLELSDEQAERIMSRRAPGMTIEEDLVINWIKETPTSAKQAFGSYAQSWRS